MVKVNRRQWLQLASGFTLAQGLNRKSVALEVTDSPVEFKVWTYEGKLLDEYSLKQLYFLDLNDEPLYTPSELVETGRTIVKIPNIPVIIALRIPVIGFGEVTLYADNRGKGYTRQDFPLNLNLAFASSRIDRVNKYLQSEQIFDLPKSIYNRLDRAKDYLTKAKAATNISSQMAWCNLSLVESLWAGELAVFDRAKRAIARQQSRKDFLFGGNFFGYNPDNSEYSRLFANIFNFATVPFYWQSFEPQQGKPNFAKVDRMVDYLQQRQIKIKGHPLVYFHEAGTPDWLKSKSYREIKELTWQHAFQITAYYRDKIPYYDIINEANNIPWANALKYDRQQFLELTRIASTASAKGYSSVQRIINHCCAWGENVAYGKPPQDSPYRYLQHCIEAEIPFEIVGLQMYYPDRDLFEIDRLLERYSKLGKPIHITELGVSSATAIDKYAQLQEPLGLWHKPWSETIQADWVEQFYTLCYSKSYIKAISWWDLADGGNFWPHGGLIRADMQPKQAYYRLDRLIRQWRSIV